ADGAIPNHIEISVVRNLPSMLNLVRPLQDEVLNSLSRSHQIEIGNLQDLGDHSETDSDRSILQEDRTHLSSVSIYNQFEKHSDSAVKKHLNPIVSELEILHEGTDEIPVSQYLKLESLQFRLRHFPESNRAFHASSMLTTLQRMGGLTIIDSNTGEPYRGDLSDIPASDATIKLIPRHQDVEQRLAEARSKSSRQMPTEVTTELANRIVELKVREEVFGISSEDWSDDLNLQAISQIIPLRQHFYEQGNLSSAQALAAAEAYAVSSIQPQQLTIELATALDFADTVIALQTKLGEITNAPTARVQGHGLSDQLPDAESRAQKIVAELEVLGITAAHDLPESWLNSAAPPFDYEMTLQAVSEAVSDPARLRGIEAAREGSKEGNSTLLSEHGEPAMTYVANAAEKSDPLLGVEVESNLPSLSMPVADFRRALMAARYVGNEHLASEIDALISSSPKAENVLLPKPFHNQAQETLDLARAKQQKAFADVIVPLASKLLETATNAGLVIIGREVTAFEGKNYSIRRRGTELKVYCHATDGFIHAKDGTPIQNRNLSKQDRETFKRFSSKSVSQLRETVPKKTQSAGLDATR
ncbi:MAG: hypothetical protein HC800_19805, partial [Phormidesmis sp. RL_2_1]|nr:hypothetical protein [Phormidesmis sp. RL_2_1]